ncbi:MAG: hypothetical protein KAS29_01835, partial [Bacteroidales bacterium]|nr:hypothetical protein [Bacteroidales bacterium]
MKRRFTGLLVALMLTPALVAQETEGDSMVKFSPDFDFRDGIFTNFEMVKVNQPFPPARIVT